MYTAPDLNGIDVAGVGPVFIQYTVTEADLQNVGALPGTVSEKAKLKALLYRDVGEEVAEKFHCDEKFLGELNPGKNGALKPGDQVKVPNVEPFELDAVKDLKPGSEIAPEAANDIPDEPEQKPNPNSEPATAPKTSVKVDVKTNMLGVFEGDKIIAAYPVTVGSRQTTTPIGEWKVHGVAKLPTFRYDEQMLKHGQRSKNFRILSPGPNNPVGVGLDRTEQTRYRHSRHGRSEYDRPGGQSWLHSVGELGRSPSGGESEGGGAGVSALRRQRAEADKKEELARRLEKKRDEMPDYQPPTRGLCQSASVSRWSMSVRRNR